MRTLSIFLITLMIAIPLTAQDLSGAWYGVLEVQGTQLRLVFNVTAADDNYTATMDSPDQGAFGIPVTKTTYENSQIKFASSDELSKLQIIFR